MQVATALAHRRVARCFQAPNMTHRAHRCIPRTRSSIHRVVRRAHRAEVSILLSRTAFIECRTSCIECRTAATEARPSLIESSISVARRPLSHLSGRGCQVTRVVGDARLWSGLVWPRSRHRGRLLRQVSDPPRCSCSPPRHRRGDYGDVRGATGHVRRQMRRVSNPTSLKLQVRSQVRDGLAREVAPLPSQVARMRPQLADAALAWCSHASRSTALETCGAAHASRAAPRPCSGPRDAALARRPLTLGAVFEA